MPPSLRPVTLRTNASMRPSRSDGGGGVAASVFDARREKVDDLPGA